MVAEAGDETRMVQEGGGAMTSSKALRRVNGFYIPAESVMAAMLEAWKEAGGTYKDLLWRALSHYAAEGEFLAALRRLDAGAYHAWAEREGGEDADSV
jgi:hypothetical protein